MRRLKCVLLMSIMLVSFFAFTGFTELAKAQVGSHRITATYYQAYVHDDHDTGTVGEWRFGLRSAAEGYTWTGTIQEWYGLQPQVEVDNAQMVNFKDQSRSWNIAGDTWFRCRAEEYDGIFYSDSLDYNSYKTVDVSFPGPSVNTWNTGSAKVGDVTHYWKYYIQNLAPTAHSINDQFVSVGLPVSFSGSGSDPEGDSISYEWDFGDNETSTEQAPTHTYADDGTYTVSFRVKDYFGEYSSYKYSNATVTHVIIDQTFISDDRCDIGSTQKVSFHAKWAHNDSDIVGGSIYVSDTKYVTDGTGWISLHPEYDTVGKHTWAVTAVNCTGITIYEKAVSDPYIIWDKVTVTLSIVGTIEVGSTATVIHTADFQYDGTDFDGTITLNDALTKSTVGTYYYTTQSISGDTHGITKFQSNTIPITFVDTTNDTTTLVAHAGPDHTVDEDTSVSFDASGSTDNVAIVSYEWDFGDGTTGTGKTTTHNYTEPGVYNVTLTVKDTVGKSDKDSITVTVEASQPYSTVFPWWILGVVGVVILVGIVGMTLLLRRRKTSKGG